MARYFYRAKNLKGREKEGLMEASGLSELAKSLKEKGYFLLSAEAEEKTKERKPLKIVDELKNLFSVPLSEKLFFTKNLEVMTKTGVPLPRAFEILQEQAKTKKFKKALQTISQEIIKGEALSKAVGRFPKIFPKIFQETLKIGEETGKLEKSLNILSRQMEREHNLKSKIKTAMVYPAIVLTLAIFIGLVMFIFAIPKLKEAFRELEVELPFTTRALLSFSDFLVSKWYWAVLICFFLGFVLTSLLKRGRGGRLTSKLVLSLPFISKISRQINSALTLRTLSSLLAAGVPVVRSLEIAAGSLNNFYFRKALSEAAVLVEKGKKVFESLEPYQKLYSPMVLEMMKVGEETGETSRVLEELARFYEKEVASNSQKLSSVIEPFLILFIGGLVGFFAISMMQPMFSITQGF